VTSPLAARVLVVDDDADLRELVTLVLADSGIGVSEAADGCEALESIRQHRPDVVRSTCSCHG
jgi:CheY-like chemotaxis protein